MKKRIYTQFISLVMAAGIFTSCSDWLNVYPSDEIKEEYLFSTGDGFRTALNGIYRKMSTFNLYGSNLTWGIIDAWGQSYYVQKAPIAGGGKAIEKIASYKFKHSELTPTTDAMWNDAWNVVANCNNLAQQIAVADSALFYNGELERTMIWGEAIGLRAFMQFDLLRIYAPAPSSVGYQEDNRTFIPYVDTYPSYVNEHRTVAYCLEHIIRDLKQAQEILLEIDGEVNMELDRRFAMGANGKDLFSRARGYRLNYYAVTAELARVYLYAGKEQEAYMEAKKLIEEEKDNGYFRASTSDYDITNYGNMKMAKDIIFALYSPTELVDWEHTINYTSVSGTNYYLCMRNDIANRIYGVEKEKDWRFIHQMELVDYSYYRPLKYHEQPSNKKQSELSNQTIPMFRMSEVYYIAAEAIFATNPDEAKEYLKLVKKGRGVKELDSSNITKKEDFIELLVNDMQREFYGEGQILYQYKRLNRIIPAANPYNENTLPTDEYVVLPLPDSEASIN